MSKTKTKTERFASVKAADTITTKDGRLLTARYTTSKQAEQAALILVKRRAALDYLAKR